MLASVHSAIRTRAVQICHVSRVAAQYVSMSISIGLLSHFLKVHVVGSSRNVVLIWVRHRDSGRRSICAEDVDQPHLLNKYN